MLSADIGVHGFKGFAAVEEQCHLTGRGAGGDLALFDDRFGDRLHGHGLRQRGGQAVEAVGPRRERSMPRLTGP